MPSRDRPGPLQPYDLRLFIPDPTTSRPPSAHLRPNKRPYSPTIGSLDSPAKRRLREGEGAKSPKYTKSPLSGSTSSARFAPGHFHALLQGSDSPAKRLDFGSSEASDETACETSLRTRDVTGGCGTPQRSRKRTPPARVRRSPRLSTRTPSSASASEEESPTSENDGQTGAEERAAATRAFAIAPLVIPRVVTPPDRQSIHYPGFDVYQDPHTVLPMASQTSCISADVSASDKGHDKENLPLRRKLSKKGSTPITPSNTAYLKAGLLSPSAKGSIKKPTPASPHPKHVHDYLATAHSLVTPKARTVRPLTSPAATLVGVTPGRTPLSKEERKQMRRTLEEEVDDVDGEDEMLL